MIEKQKSLLQTEETEKVSKKPLSNEELSSLIKASNNKKFNEYVYKKMQAAKINDELINQYYAANPPYMSVAGLKRYWEKNDK